MDPVPQFTRDSELERLLILYYAGQCSENERRRVEQALAQFPEERRALDALKGVAQKTILPHSDFEQSFERLLIRVRAERGEKGTIVRTPRHSGRSAGLRPWLWPSVVFAVLVIAFLFVQPKISGNAGVTRTYATNTAQRASLTLEDGTRVILAPQTTLRLLNFGAHARTVLLEGEAYFDVPRATGVPFIVRTGSVTARVLGTAFVVRHYNGDGRAHVAVASGKVNVASSSQRFSSVVLTAGNLGDMTDSTIQVNTTTDLMSETGWVQGKLFFRDTPLPQVLATLSRWYGYQFRFTDPALQQQNVTVRLSTQSSLAALAVLEQVLSVSLTVSGDTVTLTPRSARPASGSSKLRTYDVWTPVTGVGR